MCFDGSFSFAVMHVCGEISVSLQLPCDSSCSVRTGYVLFGTLVVETELFCGVLGH